MALHWYRLLERTLVGGVPEFHCVWGRISTPSPIPKRSRLHCGVELPRRFPNCSWLWEFVAERSVSRVPWGFFEFLPPSIPVLRLRFDRLFS